MVVNAGDKKLSSVSFPAIVGQADLKRVLEIAVVDDELDGVLLTGEKGTAKSTAVRALVDLLPDQRVVADCPYGCSPDDRARQCDRCRDLSGPPVETRTPPLVTLPLGATRDRVVGTLSIEDALAGEADFDPGLLARANRGLLYVDEINLLDDHLVDVILDAAASGVNVVERDGVSVSHPADFTLVGTMNPEEGDLRPQLRDRFATSVTVEGCRDVDDRVTIIDRALGLEDSATESAAEADEAAIEERRRTLERARERLPDVELPRSMAREIAELCLDAGVDGHRGDIATARAARAIAALSGRTRVIEPDVRRGAEFALPHRLRSRPFEDGPDLEDVLDDRFDGDDGTEGEETGDSETADGEDRIGDGESAGGDGRSDAESPGDADDRSDGDAGDRPRADSGDRPDTDGADAPGGDGEPGSGDGDAADRGRSAGASASDGSGDGGTDSVDGMPGDGSDDDGGGEDADTDDASPRAPVIPGQRRAEVGSGTAPTVDPPEVEGQACGSGTRADAGSAVDGRGARVRTERAETGESIDAAASVRAAAARGADRVEPDDLRRSVRTADSRATVVFAVDASASMRPAMRAAKGVVMDLLRESYRERDEVAFVAFAGEGAEVLLPPTRSVTLAARHLKSLPTGDRTPLPAGLETARRVVERAETDASVVVLVTDGRATVADGSPTEATRRAARGLAAEGAHVLVVDAGDGGRAALGTLVAAEAGGEVVDLDALSPERVAAAAGNATDDGS